MGSSYICGRTDEAPSNHCRACTDAKHIQLLKQVIQDLEQELDRTQRLLNLCCARADNVI